jgi:imidazolonepropionase
VPVLRGISSLVTCAPADGQGEIGAIPDGALVWREGRIAWAGSADRIPGAYDGERTFDAGGRMVVPGLIDCHTHLAFGGWRAGEFTDRIRGRSYLDIARDGGGIASTVRETRRLDEDALHARARSFADRMLESGVTTIECKSGYGLETDTELRLLRVYGRLAKEGPQRIVSTFLGAHVVPPEFRGRRGEYVDLIVEEMLPMVAREDLATFCDVFVEDGAFSPEEARRIFEVARGLGLGAKLHVDQLGDGGGGSLAADVRAVSAEHLEYVSADGISAMAAAGVVAVTLPIATLVLDQEPPPARAMIDAGLAVAVATDFNPGTAPSLDLRLALLLACTRQRMTPAEVLKGATRYAARAIGREDDLGSLEPGKAADFALLEAPDVDHLLYHYDPRPAAATVIGGTVAHGELVEIAG